MSDKNHLAVANIDDGCNLKVSPTFIRRVKQNYEKSLKQIDPEDLSQLLEEAKEEINARKQNFIAYDFCIIASEADTNTAVTVRTCLQEQLGLRGCVIDDLLYGGKDILDTYEDMMERSAKILFLITRNFNKDNFCLRIQNASVFQSLMYKVDSTAKTKCVPLLLESEIDVKIPFALSGIAGIKYFDADKSVLMLTTTFSESKLLRTILQRKVTEKYYKEILDSNIKEFLARNEHPPQLAIEACSSSTSVVLSSSSQQQCGSMQQLQAQVSNPGDIHQQLLAVLSSSGNLDENLSQQLSAIITCNHQAQTSSPSVLISGSSDFKVGNTTVINIYPKNQGNNQSSSESSDEESTNSE